MTVTIEFELTDYQLETVYYALEAAKDECSMELSNAQARRDSVNINLYRNRLAALRVIERKLRKGQHDRPTTKRVTRV